MLGVVVRASGPPRRAGAAVRDAGSGGGPGRLGLAAAALGDGVRRPTPSRRWAAAGASAAVSGGASGSRRSPSRVKARRSVTLMEDAWLLLARSAALLVARPCRCLRCAAW